MPVHSCGVALLHTASSTGTDRSIRWEYLPVWLLVDAYMLIVGSSWIDEGAGTAWTVYPPLSLGASHGGLSVDVFLISLHAAGGSSLTGAVNMICTVTYARRVHSTLLQVSLYP
jgi:cytochrome c oxidase subunit 1